MKPTLHSTWCKVLIALYLILAGLTTYAQNVRVVYQGEITEIRVVQEPGTTYTWELYNTHENIDFAIHQGNCPSTMAYFIDGVNYGNSVNIMWVATGEYFFKVTGINQDGCMNLKVGRVIVESGVASAAILQPGEICYGEPGYLQIQFTGVAPWSILLESNDGTTTDTITIGNILTNPMILEVHPTQTTAYRILQVTDSSTTNSNPTEPVTLTVKPRPVSSPIYRYTPQAKKN